ncbi:MAG: hypothetical protein AAGJ37_17760 [Pseudomonadota bacterium]
MHDEKIVDPRLVLYEELYQQVHRQIFDITSSANGLGQLAVSTQSDIPDAHPYFAEIKRAFSVTSNVEKHEVAAFRYKLNKLEALLEDTSKPNLLKANAMVAAVCTILYKRIWNTIPIDLQKLPDVTDEILENMRAHERMWDHLLLE